MGLHHFYHVYADGAWETPVAEHCAALIEGGLYDRLTTFKVGFVGSVDNVRRARKAIDAICPFECCTVTRHGFEQETLDELWFYAHDHDGLVSYAHTKGAANWAAINDAWRRSMTFHNIVDWRRPVAALEAGASIAGCHWICGGRAANPDNGTGGMFGGNYWWTHLELVRQNVRPTRNSRMDAEHWLGQLSECMPITPATICDLLPRPIIPQALTEWRPAP